MGWLSSNQNNKVKLNSSHKLACPEPSLLMIVLFNKNNYNNNSTAEAWYRLVTVNGWVFDEGMLDRKVIISYGITYTYTIISCGITPKTGAGNELQQAHALWDETVSQHPLQLFGLISLAAALGRHTSALRATRHLEMLQGLWDCRIVDCLRAAVWRPRAAAWCLKGAVWCH